MLKAIVSLFLLLLTLPLVAQNVCPNTNGELDLSWQFPSEHKVQKIGDCFVYAVVAEFEAAVKRHFGKSFSFSEEFVLSAVVNNYPLLRIMSRVQLPHEEARIDGGRIDWVFKAIQQNPESLIPKFEIKRHDYIRIVDNVLNQRMLQLKKFKTQELRNFFMDYVHPLPSSHLYRWPNQIGSLSLINIPFDLIPYFSYQWSKAHENFNVMLLKIDKISTPLEAGAGFMGRRCPRAMEKIKAWEKLGLSSDIDLELSPKRFLSALSEDFAPCLTILSGGPQEKTFLPGYLELLAKAIQIQRQPIRDCDQISKSFREKILNQLCLGRPVTVELLSDSYLTGETVAQAKRQYTASSTDGHAVVITGTTSYQGQKYFVIRNSNSLEPSFLPFSHACAIQSAHAIN
ncbi:MAG: hypothetical protein WCG27_06675 [Pseudomonadota bacterium]